MNGFSRLVGAALLALAAAVICAAPASALSVLNRGNGAEPKSLDPHFIDGIAEVNIDGDILMGLTTFDAAGHTIPGAATSWQTSPDGKIWTFHLRRHQWSDGTPVTAQDFVFAWQRLLEPKTGAFYAYNLWVIRNAHAISEGKLPPSALGVKALDDATLEVTLEHAAPYLPELLTHNTAFPLPRGVVLAKGNQWSRPGNFVGNGAYVPKEWIPNDHITLVRNPHFYDAAHVRIDVVNYYPTQDTQAGLRRFRAGELDTQTPIPLSEIDWIRTNLKNALHSTQFIGMSYVAMNEKRPPLNDARLREAMNLAYNREVVAEKVLRFGDKPAYALVPPNVANFPGGAELDFVRMPYPDRIRKAQALMAELGYGPSKHFHTTYETPGEPDNRRIAAVFQAMMKQIYIDVDIVVVDEAIHFRTLQQGQFDTGTASWFADFNDASNFLDLLRHDGGNNLGRYDNPKFDATLDAAQEEPDATKRGQILLEAEKIALKDYPWIPTRWRMTQDLVQPYVKGWVENDRQYNLTRWLWLDGKPAK
jgi:oligopeptide transport system substrate-binding protein